jgi:hypothetical protein
MGIPYSMLRDQEQTENEKRAERIGLDETRRGEGGEWSGDGYEVPPMHAPVFALALSSSVRQRQTSLSRLPGKIWWQ